MSSPSHTASDDKTTVFVSYSRVDREEAIPIITLLKDAGFKVWWDGMLEAGERYLETTEQALESALAVVVIWSKNSVQSDWVRDEAMSGRDRKCLVPVSLDGTMPPLGFRQIQVIDMTGWIPGTQSVRSAEILRTVAALHDQPVPATPEPSRVSRPAASSTSVSRRGLLIGGGLVAAAAAGYTGLRMFGGSSAASLDPQGVVVLPFENLSTSADNDVLASALDVEVRKSLARNPALKVVARTSSVAVQREGLSPVDIGRQLGVACLLEGSVVLSGGILRISTSLIEGLSGVVRWSRDYEGNPEDILTFQSDIARAVTANVTNVLSEPDASKRYGDASNPVAFREFLKGQRAYRIADGEEGLVSAIGHFDRAIALDPDFAAAHAIKARLYIYRATLTSSTEEAEEQRQLALSFAQSAIDLAPDSDDAFSTLGYVNFFARLDAAAARAPYETSRQLGYGNAVILARYGEFAACDGNDAAAVDAMRRATELDPLNATIFGRFGFVHYLAGRYPQALEGYNRALKLRPTNFHRPSEIGLARFYAGEAQGALDSCREEENGMERFPCEAIALNALGQTEDAEVAKAALISDYGDAGLYQQAQVAAQSGELDECQEILERALELKDTGLTLAKMDPALDPMRGRPEFQALLARMGFDA